MDEFGVLVESIGFKPYGKSAPMSKSKPKPKSTTNLTPNTSSSSLADDSSSLPVEMLDGVFRSSVNINRTKQHDDFLGGDDVFGASSSQFGEVDLESVLNVSSSDKKNSGGNLNSVGSDGRDDLLGLNSGKSDRVGGDFFGVNSGEKQGGKDDEVEDLIPGFGGASSSNKELHSETNRSPGSNVNPSNASSAVEDDPFVVLESSASQSAASWPFAGPSEQETGKDTVQVSLDDLDDFVMGHNDSSTDRSRNKTDQPSGTTSNGFNNLDDIDALFGGVQQKPAARAPSTAEDPPVDLFFSEEKGSQVKQTSSWYSSNSKNASSTSTGDDFTSLFGDVTTSSGEFHEIEGEPEERRRARLKSHMRTNARVAEALAEMNKRDLQSQYEQEEKHRLAESLDNQIKLWAAGKEGNLRALLSSLQQVLWPECGWRAVSLTDLITSDSVKKVYKKAALYVHPDKVQQKGANLQQKYIAEKVFDLLKEAWNKFSAEELR